MKHGTGGIHVDACRFAPGDDSWPGPNGEPDEVDRSKWTDAERLADKALKSLPNGSLDRIRARDVIETVKVKRLQGDK